MASGRPWYKRSGSDFVFGVMHFPDNDHRYAYSAIVDMLNDRDRPIPDDPAFIAGFAGMTKRKWGIVRAYLIEHGYLVVTDRGEITNPRFERERAERLVDAAAAVENGRKGGRASAAARAAGQGDLGLSGGLSPDYPPDNRRIIAGKTQDDPAIMNGHSHENNDLAEAPPQPSRAREEARGQSLEKKESAPPPNPTTPRDAAARSDDLGREGVLNIARALARAAGVTLRPERPDAFIREVDQVKAWINDGIDVDKTILPSIAGRVARLGDETVGSLKFFDGWVRKAHARVVNAGTTAEPPSLAKQRDNLANTVALYRKMRRDEEADALERQLVALDARIAGGGGP